MTQRTVVVNSRRAGFTLLELLIAGTILVAMMGVVFMFTLRGQEMARLQTKESALRDKAMTIVEEACDDIRQCGADQTVPPYPDGTNNTVKFTRITGLDDTGTLTYAGAAIIFALVPADGEVPNNKQDDNGDGLIDELRLQYSSGELDGGGNAISGTIATGVKGYDADTDTNMVGFRFRRPQNDDRIRLSLTLQRFDVRSGRTLEQTYNSGVTFRN